MPRGRNTTRQGGGRPPASATTERPWERTASTVYTSRQRAKRRSALSAAPPATISSEARLTCWSVRGAGRASIRWPVRSAAVVQAATTMSIWSIATRA